MGLGTDGPAVRCTTKGGNIGALRAAGGASTAVRLGSATVAAFDPESDLGQDLAYRLVRASFVTLFHRQEVLTRTTQWLKEHEYQLVRLDAGGWGSEVDLHRAMGRALNFPPDCGHTLDALNGCVRAVVEGRYGWDERSVGLVLIFHNYERFARRSPYASQVVLEIIADQARGGALLGRRLICLVQSDNPEISFEPLGMGVPPWNEAERLDRRSA
jgi:hypothetical protein